MPEERENAVTGWGNSAKPGAAVRQAFVGSVLLHAVLILALARLPSSIVEPAPPAPLSVRLASAVPSTQSTAAASAETAEAPAAPVAPRRRDTGPRAQPEPARPELPEPVEPIAPEPPAETSAESADDVPVAEPLPEPAAERSSPVRGESPNTPPRDESPDAPPRDVDWEAEMRRAAREVVEQRAREQQYSTFSLEDLEEPAPPEEPGPERSVFESDLSGPSLLSPQKPRSRAGRWLVEKCERFTGGGMSLFGIMSLCAPSNARNDLFASIKPDYLKARPVCTELPSEGTQAAAGEPKKTHDCRLVVETSP